MFARISLEYQTLLAAVPYKTFHRMLDFTDLKVSLYSIKTAKEVKMYFIYMKGRFVCCLCFTDETGPVLYNNTVS